MRITQQESQETGDGPSSSQILDAAAQKRVIARATRLQEERLGGVTVDQLAEAAREAGLDPALVREAAAQDQEIAAQEALAVRAARDRRRRLWMSSPALLSLLSLLAVPTHNGIWFVSMSALAFTCYLSPTSASGNIEKTTTEGKQ